MSLGWAPQCAVFAGRGNWRLASKRSADARARLIHFRTFTGASGSYAYVRLGRTGAFCAFLPTVLNGPTYTVVRRGERATSNVFSLTLEQKLQVARFCSQNSLWECVPMDANDCREYSNRCIEMANEAATDASQTKLLRWGKAWLNLAEEIDNDAILRNQVRAVIAIERTRCVKNRPRARRAPPHGRAAMLVFGASKVVFRQTKLSPAI